MAPHPVCLAGSEDDLVVPLQEEVPEGEVGIARRIAVEVMHIEPDHVPSRLGRQTPFLGVVLLRSEQCPVGILEIGQIRIAVPQLARGKQTDFRDDGQARRLRRR